MASKKPDTENPTGAGRRRADDDAQICIIKIFDADGAESIEVAHTVAGTIKITHYGDNVADFDYDEARAVMKALRVLLEEV